MPPLHPDRLSRTFDSVSSLLNDAHTHGVNIDPEGLPILLDTVEYYAGSAESHSNDGHFPLLVVDDWRKRIAESNGQIMTATNIWDWIKRWFPDPISAGLIRRPGKGAPGGGKFGSGNIL